MKIQTKLILGFLIIYLLFGSVVFISVYESSKSLEKIASDDLVTLSHHTIEEIDKEINERIVDFKAISGGIDFQQLLKESNKEFGKLDDVQAYISQKDNEWVSAPKNDITPFMQQLIDNPVSTDLRQKTKFFENNFGYRLYGEVFVTNKYGANAAETGKTTDYRQDDEEWWQKAKSEGVYVEELKYDQSADVYSTAIGIRIDDENEDFIGVIKVVLNIETVINIIKETEAQKKFSSAEYTLVDGKGRVIFSTRNYEIFQPFSLFSAIKDKEGALTAKDAQTGTEKLVIRVHSKGYRNFNGLGWILVVDVDRSEILKPIKDLTLTILIFAIILIVLAGAIGFYIYSAISSSLRKFENTISEIAKGNLDARVDIKTKDEFKTLADAFNSMADELKNLKKVQIIQKSVKELDALEASNKIGFISEETYQKAKKRLTELLEKPKNIDARLLQEKGFIKKSE